MLKKLIKSFVRRFGHELVNATQRWGLDFRSDIERFLPATALNTIIDVGANDGGTTVALAKRYPAARIFSCEPVPKTFALLCENTKKLRQVVPLCVALGSKNENKQCYLYPENSLVSSLLSDAPFAKEYLAPNSATMIEVAVSTLDKIAKENALSNIDLLKVDTEGNDLDVLQGAGNLLKHGAIKFIYCEFYTVSGKETDIPGNLVGIVDLLASHSFSLAGVYTDHIIPDQKFFCVRNALFVNRAILPKSAPR